MPELCQFYGIVSKLFFNDHNPPHFHAEYGDDEALIDMNTLAVFAGKLPPRALGLVVEGATRPQEELQAAWEHAQNLEPPGKIAPLD